jgi:hypothetical protein
MDRFKRGVRTPFGSALLGGFVVAMLGWLAIAAGWVSSDDDGATTTVAAAPLTQPASAPGKPKGETVN